MTAAKPSRMSSPVRLGSFSLSSFLSLAYLFTTVVSAAAETLLVGAALVGVDGVGEGVHRLGVAGVPLHRDLDLVAGALAVEVDDALAGSAVLVRLMCLTKSTRPPG